MKSRGYFKGLICILLGLALLHGGKVAAAPEIPNAGTLLVNTANDSNARGDAELSLREAIQIANGTLSGPFSAAEKSQMFGCTFNASGYITNACGGGNNTILFAPSLLQVNLNGRLDVLSATGVTINGQVAAGRVIVNSSVADLAFWIGADNTTVENITVINASLPIGIVSNLPLKHLRVSNAYLGVAPGMTSCASPPLVRRPDFGFILFMGSGSAALGDGSAYLTNSVLGCANYDGVAVSNVSYAYIGADETGSPDGNWIGVDPAGHALPNGNSGVSLCCGSNVKGTSVDNNLIANNLDQGVFLNLTDPASGNTISRNTIYNNGLAGIKVSNSGANILINNIVHNNGSSGIWLSGASSIHNAITGGAIFANGAAGISEGQGAGQNTWSGLSLYANFGLGIDKLDNGIPDFPPLSLDSTSTDARGVLVNGSLFEAIFQNTIYRIELYRVSPDPSGFGEGSQYIGSTDLTWNSGGNYLWSIPDLSGVGCYTATLTVINAGGDTSSEFSSNLGTRCLLAYLPEVRR